MILKPTERDALLVELKTVMVGIEGTDDRGMAGDLKEIKRTLIKQNGRIRKNTLTIISLTSFLVGLGVLEWRDVINIFGG